MLCLFWAPTPSAAARQPSDATSVATAGIGAQAPERLAQVLPPIGDIAGAVGSGYVGGFPGSLGGGPQYPPDQPFPAGVPYPPPMPAFAQGPRLPPRCPLIITVGRGLAAPAHSRIVSGRPNCR